MLFLICVESVLCYILSLLLAVLGTVAKLGPYRVESCAIVRLGGCAIFFKPDLRLKYW